MTDRITKERLLRLQTAFHRLEDLIIAGLLTATMVLALYQIVLRNFMGSGLVWGDFLIRLMVLWLGMAGAMAATRERRHISVDLVTRFLPPGWRRVTQALTAFFAGGVSIVAAYYSLQFVISEYQFGSLAFAQVPYWVCVSILPLAFFVIAGRYFLQAGVTLAQPPKALP